MIDAQLPLRASLVDLFVPLLVRCDFTKTIFPERCGCAMIFALES
jgi:hypothetical protein